MTVYIKLTLLHMEEKTVSAEVTAVHDDGAVDLRLADGSEIGAWRGPMYDINGNEIPLETVRRDFLPQDTTALMARIAQLEQAVTQPQGV